MTAVRKLPLLALLAVLLAALLGAPRPAAATPAPTTPPGGGGFCWCDNGYTGLATMSYTVAHNRLGIGANSATGYGWAQVTGWQENSNARWYPTYKLSDRSPALAFRNPALAGCAWWELFCFDGHPVWYKPTSWNWPALFAWDGSLSAGMYADFIQPCMTGIAQGDLGYVSSRFLVKLAIWARLSQFALLKATPQGFTVALVGGCLLHVLKW